MGIWLALARVRIGGGAPATEQRIAVQPNGVRMLPALGPASPRHSYGSAAATFPRLTPRLWHVEQREISWWPRGRSVEICCR
jgi:hypothetical protein